MNFAQSSNIDKQEFPITLSISKYPCPFITIVNENSTYSRTEISFSNSDNTLNQPPNIDSLVVADTLIKPSSGFTIDSVSAYVSDPDSVEDVAEVFFYSLRPDSQYANNGNPFYLENKGNGKFSLIFSIWYNNMSGTYTWTFYAKDLSGALSDSVVHYITLLDDSTTNITSNNSVSITKYLEQNYPNPFNPKTTIRYHLPKNLFVEISIYNSIGEKINTLVAERQTFGAHSVEFNGSNLPSGIYFYEITSGEFTESKKCLLLK